jgi:hypothetical protein
VIVSKIPLGPRLARQSSLAPALLESRAATGSPGGALRDAPAPCHRLSPRPTLNVAFVAPRSESEAKMVEVWTRCLGMDALGVNDDFFALGGDSLLAVQLAHQLRTALQVELPTHLLLEHPTIAALSARLGHAPAGQGVSPLVRLAREPAAARPLFLIHPVGGQVYFYLPLTRELCGVAPIYGLQARGVDGEAPPLCTIEELAASYVSAIRTVQPQGPYRLGGSSFGGVVAFEMAQQLAHAAEEVEMLALIDSPGRTCSLAAALTTTTCARCPRCPRMRGCATFWSTVATRSGSLRNPRWRACGTSCACSASTSTRC